MRTAPFPRLLNHLPTRLLALVLASVLAAGALAGCKDKPAPPKPTVDQRR